MKGLSANQKMHVLSHSLLRCRHTCCDGECGEVTPSQAAMGCGDALLASPSRLASGSGQGRWEEQDWNREPCPKFLFIS